MQKFLKVVIILTLMIILRNGFALAAEQVYFYYTDPAGTPLAMSDTSGAIVWRADYLPFGEESVDLATVENNKMFVGKERDGESRLYYFGARYMDSGIGRFGSPDSVGAVNSATGNVNLKILSNPQRLNVYAYGLNNPHRYVDPDGNTPWDILDIAFFAHSAATFINSPSSDNGINLALDTIGLLPIIPALGAVKRIAEGAGKIDHSATVLGKYPDYLKMADKLGARRFNVPTDIWNKMSKTEQWTANQKFLDRMIARGDNIVLSNPVRNINDVTGSFRKELDYLGEKGFRLSEDGTRMIR